LILLAYAFQAHFLIYAFYIRSWLLHKFQFNGLWSLSQTHKHSLKLILNIWKTIGQIFFHIRFFNKSLLSASPS